MLGHYCNQDCLTLGHSDACWLPSNSSSKPFEVDVSDKINQVAISEQLIFEIWNDKIFDWTNWSIPYFSGVFIVRLGADIRLQLAYNVFRKQQFRKAEPNSPPSPANSTLANKQTLPCLNIFFQLPQTTNIKIISSTVFIESRWITYAYK